MSHPLLERQLRRLGLDPDTPPDPSQFALLLERIAAAYQAADTERYLLERSFRLSSEEMQELHRTLRAREAEHGALRRVATAVASEEEPQVVFDLVAKEAACLFGVEGGCVVRFGEVVGHVEGLWSTDAERGHIPRTAPILLDGMGGAARVFQTGAPVRVDDYAALADGLASQLAARSYASSVAVPVRVRGALWGAVIAAGSRRDSLPESAGDTLAELAGALALALANSEARAQLKARATSDPLTGLANHREFHERLAGEVARAGRERTPLSLVLIDLDHFKQVNDVHGHQVGDEVLRETAARLAASARAGELVGRVGGEEFAWLLPGAPVTEALAAAERAREAIRSEPFTAVGDLTISCGVCDLATATTTGELLRLADRALYSAKSLGRDLAVAYSPSASLDLSTGQRAAKIERAQALHALRALARAIDARDAYTQQHSERVADIAVKLATAAGWSVIECARLREAALVHDVGKIGVSDSILLKPGRLTPAEFQQVKEHAALGAKIVQEVLMDDQVAWIAHHHERWEGGGYPDGLSGEQIPEGARLLAVADTWDAITVERGYGSPMSREQALAECQNQSGRQFWPGAIDALARLVAVGALGPEPPGGDGSPSEAPAIDTRVPAPITG